MNTSADTITYASLNEVLNELTLDETVGFSRRFYSAHLEGNRRDLSQAEQILKNHHFGGSSVKIVPGDNGGSQLTLNIRDEDLPTYNQVTEMNLTTELQRFNRGDSILSRDTAADLIENIRNVHSALKTHGASRDMKNECRQLMIDLQKARRGDSIDIPHSRIMGFMSKVTENLDTCHTLKEQISRTLKPSGMSLSPFQA